MPSVSELWKCWFGSVFPLIHTVWAPPGARCSRAITSSRSSGYTPPTGAIAGGRGPVFEVCTRETALLELAVQKNLEEIPHTLVVIGVDVVVPLFEPRNELGNADQQRRQALDDPAFLFHQLSVPGGQGSGLLQVIPTSPGNYQSRVVRMGAAGVADEALFGHVERATQPPAGGVEEICRCVLRRGWNVAEFFLFAAPLYGRQARLELLGALVELACQVVATSGSMASSRRCSSQVRSQTSRLRAGGLVAQHGEKGTASASTNSATKAGTSNPA